MDAFQEWHWSEEHTHTIELRVAKVEHGVATLGRTLWMTKHVYQCARQRIGQKADQKKQPEREQKVPRKGTGCRCQIVIKCYPHTPVVLGRYLTEHNHELGAENMIYTRLSDGSRQHMKSLLIQKVDAGEIVSTSLFDRRLYLIQYCRSGSFARRRLTVAATNSSTLVMLAALQEFWTQKPSAYIPRMVFP
jgi:hypothetical protein